MWILRIPSHQCGVMICLFSSLNSLVSCEVLLMQIAILPWSMLMQLLPSMHDPAGVFPSLLFFPFPTLAPTGPSGLIHPAPSLGKSEEHHFVIYTFIHSFIDVY